jgi:hypothetical protein
MSPFFNQDDVPSQAGGLFLDFSSSGSAHPDSGNPQDDSGWCVISRHVDARLLKRKLRKTGKRENRGTSYSRTSHDDSDVNEDRWVALEFWIKDSG